jgi:hypothetical protein
MLQARQEKKGFIGEHPHSLCPVLSPSVDKTFFLFINRLLSGSLPEL